MNIQCKRVYDPAEQSDGYRVLVDRLWPRGIKKTDLALDEWDIQGRPEVWDGWRDLYQEKALKLVKLFFNDRLRK